MGMVAMTYKINPDAEMEDVDTDMISSTISTFGDDNYDVQNVEVKPCLLYTSPSPRDLSTSRMPSSA